MSLSQQKIRDKKETRNDEKRQVLEILKRVYDPDYRDRSIVDMGLVDENSVHIDDKTIMIEYKLTAPFCPFSSAIGVMIKHVLEKKLNKKVYVKLRSEHEQARIVNEILENEDKCKDLLQKLGSYGILERCVKA